MTTRSNKVQGLDSSFKELSISHPSTLKVTKAPVADSWEEAAASSSEDEDTLSQPSTPTIQETPGPPPPTPISPTSRHSRNKSSTDWTTFNTPLPPSYPSGPSNTSRSPPSDSEKRPEKTRAVAERMIAGALGVRAPKKTEEGKAYEKALRDNERKRREKVKGEAEREDREREEARRAVWDE